MEKIIASSLSQQIRKIKKQPGAYRWWFPKEEAKELWKHFKNEMLEKNFELQEREIDGEPYIAMYYGISNNMRNRICNHLFGPFRSSTFRKTLGSIIATNKDSMESLADKVDKLIDKCYWEYGYVDSKKEAENNETKELKKNAYPLNIDKNRTVTKDWKDYLTDLRNGLDERFKQTKTK